MNQTHHNTHHGHQSLQPLTYDEFIELSKAAQIIDTRVSLSAGVVDGAINITFKAPTFDALVQSLVPLNKNILVISDPGLEEESVLKLTKQEYNNVQGYLKGGFEDYKKSGGKISQFSIVGLVEFVKGEEDLFLDVRSPAECQEGIFPGAVCIPFTELHNNLAKLPKEKTIHVYCMTGGRAKIGASILQNNGYEHIVITEQGGLDAILAANKIEKVVI